MVSWALSKPCLSSEDQKSTLTGLRPSWIRLPCFPLLYCQHQIFRGKSKKSCFPLYKASLCSQIFAIPAARCLKQQECLQLRTVFRDTGEHFSLLLKDTQVCLIPAQHCVHRVTHPLSTAHDLKYLSTFLPQGNLYFCRAGTFPEG